MRYIFSGKYQVLSGRLVIFRPHIIGEENHNLCLVFFRIPRFTDSELGGGKFSNRRLLLANSSGKHPDSKRASCSKSIATLLTSFVAEVADLEETVSVHLIGWVDS